MNTHCTIWATWFFAYELLLSLPKLRRCLIFDLFLSVFDFWRFDLVALFRLLRWCCFNVLFLSFSGHVCVIRIRYSYRNCVLLCFFTSILFLVFFSVWGFEVVFILLLNQKKKETTVSTKTDEVIVNDRRWESFFLFFFLLFVIRTHTRNENYPNLKHKMFMLLSANVPFHDDDKKNKHTRSNNGATKNIEYNSHLTRQIGWIKTKTVSIGRTKETKTNTIFSFE